MKEKYAGAKENSSPAGSANDSKSFHTSDSGNGNTVDLRGALPPPKPDETLVESQEKLEPIDKPSPRGLKRWGLWRRLSGYWEIRQHERSNPDFWRDGDIGDNARGRLPDGEDVQVPAIWVAELYTPSTVSGLLKGISDLGWEYGRRRDDSLTKWMNDVREGRQAGWTSLGLVSPSNAAHFMSERTALLPSGVTAALPILMSLTPSVTAFVVVFLFDDNVASSLKTPLREEFRTSTRRYPNFHLWQVARHVLLDGPISLGYRIKSPDIIRREAVKSRLQEIEDACVHWVRDRLPGAFASLPGSQTPTAVLFVTEQARPLSEDTFKIRAFEGLAINRHYDAWESDEWPGARLVLPRGWDDEGNRLVFGCRRHDAFPLRPGYHEPTSNWTIAQRSDDLVRGLLSRWSITCLLDSYHEALSALRDRTAHDGRYRPIQDLKELRSLIRTTLYDIDACSQEIVEFSQSDSRYRHDVLEMSYVREVRGMKPDLLSDLSASQNRRALQIQREAAILRSALSTSNDLSQTITNILIQRFVLLLTLVSIGIALWAVFLTLRTVP